MVVAMAVIELSATLAVGGFVSVDEEFCCCGCCCDCGGGSFLAAGALAIRYAIVASTSTAAGLDSIFAAKQTASLRKSLLLKATR